MNKLLIIQIDALAYPVLQKALTQNLMPFTKSLIDKGWKLEEIFSGLPSTTPAAHLGILYGATDVVTGFRSYDKHAREIIDASDLKSILKIEEIAQKRFHKVLADICFSVCVIFSGKSKKSFSHANRPKTLRDSTAFSKPLLAYFTQPISTLLFFSRLLVYLLLIRLEDKKLTSELPSVGTAKGMLKRLGEELLAAEFAYYVTRQGIEQQENVIFTDFIGYDELAHNYGPEHPLAIYYLSIIDLYLKRLYRQRLTKNYELMIFSDHGSTLSMPYGLYFHETLGQSIQKLYPQTTIFEQKKIIENSPNTTIDLFLLYSGGLALIYDAHSGVHLSQKQFESRFPKFAEKVSKLPGIDLVVMRKNLDFIAYKNGWAHVLNLQNLSLILATLDERYRAKVYGQLIKLLNSEFAADVFVFAGKLDPNTYACFEDQIGAHGSFGGMQTQSFLLTNKIKIAADKIDQIGDLHHYLYAYVFSGSK